MDLGKLIVFIIFCIVGFIGFTWIIQYTATICIEVFFKIQNKNIKTNINELKQEMDEIIELIKIYNNSIEVSKHRLNDLNGEQNEKGKNDNGITTKN